MTLTIFSYWGCMRQSDVIAYGYCIDFVGPSHLLSCIIYCGILYIFVGVCVLYSPSYNSNYTKLDSHCGRKGPLGRGNNSEENSRKYTRPFHTKATKIV